MRKRRIKKGSKFEQSRNSLKSMKCVNYSKCGHEEMVDADCVSVVCSLCVQSKVGIDPKFLAQGNKKVVKKSETGFPRGWHLYKQFVHSDGRVFEHGKENESLKGTLPPTTVKVSTLSKTERRKLREEKKARREARLARKYEKRMKALKKKK